ncbi:MAG: hypothetical protein HKN85_03725, partial [Gammaproteobacteria bacterium]|nr:hypothetical protein [Gammaproteobacteria bacterium]
MSELSFFLLYIAILTLPGLVLTGFYKARPDPFLTTVSASYALFSLAFICANHYSVSAGTFITAIAGVLLIAVICLAWRFREIGNRWPRFNQRVLTPIVAISVLSAIYQLIFGSFTEVPADLFTHLERYQSSLRQLNRDSLGPAFSWQALLSQKSGVFYYLLAITALASDASAETVITVVDYCNRTLLLIAVFFFSRGLFKKSPQATAIAGLTVLLLAAHMGINVFAYVRYYTLAPAMLNMVIYLAAVSVFLRVIAFPLDRSTLIQYFFILLLVAAAASIHV